MAVTRLALTDFRSYASALITPGHGFVVLTGENGAGKTNVLEAISLLSPGRGLRRAALADMARSGGPGGFSIAARVDTQGGSVDLGTGTAPAAAERRLVRVNGAGSTASALGEWLSLLWLTPAMDRLFIEGAEGRRGFLDRLVLAVEPGHAVHAGRYESAMRERNRLLRDTERPDGAWLDALEARMADHGALVASARAETVAALNARSAQQADGPFARAGLAIAGWASDEAATFQADLRRSRPRDAAAGRTLAGPHRQDLMVSHIAKAQAAARASTGEQKALLLGIVLAHADLVADRAGRRPILLMDEVAAHLDPLRRAALFDRLAAGGGQIWLTGTEPALFDGLGRDATWLRVQAGVIEG